MARYGQRNRLTRITIELEQGDLIVYDERSDTVTWFMLGAVYTLPRQSFLEAINLALEMHRKSLS